MSERGMSLLAVALLAFASGLCLAGAFYASIGMRPWELMLLVGCSNLVVCCLFLKHLWT